MFIHLLERETRRFVMKKSTFYMGLVIIIFTFGVSINGRSQAVQQSVPKVKVGPALKAKSTSPGPPTAAKDKTQKTSIGKGKTSVSASGPSSFWTESIDVDDDGSVETSDFLYDSQRGVVYTYREDDFACPNGKPEKGSILEALYTTGNKSGNPVGSGWYVVGLNAGQCAAKEAETFGCKFDASGNPTACGAAAINTATGEVVMSSLSSRPSIGPPEFDEFLEYFECKLNSPQYEGMEFQPQNEEWG
jgi:hypothetical protein